jgi:chromosomal replication initiation ATPase DnaA
MTPHIYAGLPSVQQSLYFRTNTKINNTINIKDLIEVAAEASGCDVIDLKNGSRHKKVINAKRLMCYILYNFYGLTLHQTAERVGLKEHGTVIHHIRTFENLLSINDKETIEMFKTFKLYLSKFA